MIDIRLQHLAVLLLAGFLAACGTTPPLAVPQGECHAAADANRSQLIIGYGSLMQEESRKRTSPQAGPAHPVYVKGYRRGWFARAETPSLSPTFLGAVRDPAGRFNAVIYQVDQAELVATDKREGSYCRASVALSEIELLEKGFATPADAQAWIYVSRPDRIGTPGPRYPIVQSYVDIFVTGCMEQEQRLGIAEFARQCLATTGDWSEHWVNDRIHPRRPFIHQPKARQIDDLLSRQLPREFSRIRIEGG